MEKIKKIFAERKELILYVFFGGMTTLVNYIVYFSLTRVFSVNEIFSNVAAWFIAVLFAYVTNKIWVFESKSTEIKMLARELLMFFSARLFSGFLDTALLFILFTCIGINDVFVKVFSCILVVILNYFFSKFIIFKKWTEFYKLQYKACVNLYYCKV